MRCMICPQPNRKGRLHLDTARRQIYKLERIGTTLYHLPTLITWILLFKQTNYIIKASHPARAEMKSHLSAISHWSHLKCLALGHIVQASQEILRIGPWDPEHPLNVNHLLIKSIPKNHTKTCPWTWQILKLLKSEF